MKLHTAPKVLLSLMHLLALLVIVHLNLFLTTKNATRIEICTVIMYKTMRLAPFKSC